MLNVPAPYTGSHIPSPEVAIQQRGWALPSHHTRHQPRTKYDVSGLTNTSSASPTRQPRTNASLARHQYVISPTPIRHRPHATHTTQRFASIEREGFDNSGVPWVTLVSFAYMHVRTMHPHGAYVQTSARVDKRTDTRTESRSFPHTSLAEQGSSTLVNPCQRLTPVVNVRADGIKKLPHTSLAE